MSSDLHDVSNELGYIRKRLWEIECLLEQAVISIPDDQVFASENEAREYLIIRGWENRQRSSLVANPTNSKYYPNFLYKRNAIIEKTVEIYEDDGIFKIKEVV